MYNIPKPSYGSNFVPPDGPENADVYVIGEAPGVQEDRFKRPFVGESGDELNKLYLPKAGLRRSDVRVNNIWPFNPPDNRDPLPEEVALGLPALLADITKVNPKYIVALGKIAGGVFKADINMELDHGVPFEWQGRTVVVSYHPAFGMRQPRMMNFLLWDWERVGHIVKSQFPIVGPVQDRNYYGLLDELPITAFGISPVAVDTETDEGNPWMIQTSVNPRTAFCCLTDNPMDTPVFKEWLEFTESVIYHNAPFDHNILEQCNIHPRKWTDTMQMAYLLGNQHQGLKTLAYKHLGVKMQSYTETVRPSARRRAKEYLEQISNQSITHAEVFKTKKQWNEYKKAEGLKPLDVKFDRIESTKEWKVVWELPTIPDPAPVWKHQGKQLVETQPTNIVKRVRSLLKKIEDDPSIDPVEKWNAMENVDQAIEQYGPMPEGSLADIPFKDAVAYACKDADMTLRLYHVLQPMIEAAGLQDALDTDMAIVPYILDMQRYGMKVDAAALEAFGVELDDRMKQLDFRIQQEVYNKGIIADGEVFNPNSPPQVKDALAAYGEHPKSTEQKYLEPLVRKVPWLRDHMEYKKLGKLRSTYVDNIIKSSSVRDGRLYTNFNMSRTDTGRLSSSKPVNLQNIPVRSDDGHRIREAFVPEAGWIYTAIDYSQIEMRVAAHMSQDQLMLRMFREGLDIHGETSDRIFGDRTKEHRYAAKRVGFGVMYGISGIGLKELFESEGVTDWTEDQCDNMINEWFKVYSGVAAMMKGFEHDARTKGYLTGMFGRRYYVPEAMSTVARVASGGVRKAGNAPIQGGAQGIIKRAMGKLVPVYRSINAGGVMVKPVNQVHDELMFEVQESFVESWIKIATPIMEGAYQLSVPVLCDVEIGYSWGSCAEIGDWRTFNFNEWKEKQDA